MKIKIYELHTNELLASFKVDQSESAYSFAKQMEEIGVEIKMDFPSVSHSLGASLGMNPEQLDELTDAMNKEIESHNDTENKCCQ